MRWKDRVYGNVTVTDPGILRVIATPTFQRLRGIRQAGPSAIAFPFKNVTRSEHSLGVYLLLRRLGVGFQEQVAGLLHDISHTAFSHAVDFLVTSEDQDHHESLKPRMLDRSDLAAAIRSLEYQPSDFYDDRLYPVLERSLPWLCADRMDYFLRDGVACGVVTAADAARILDRTTVIDSTIVLTDAAMAREVQTKFDEMNRNWWASATEAYIYNEFADVLREGFRLKAISEADLLSDDATVLAKLDAAGSTTINTKLDRIRRFDPAYVHGYKPRVIPKERWLDPPVLVDGLVRLLSELT